MTRKDAENRLAALRLKREELVDLIAEADAQSGTASAGGGTRSFTNRQTADVERKLKVVEREIARYEAALGLRADPGKVKTIYPRFV